MHAADITPSRPLRQQGPRRWTHCGMLLPIKASALRARTSRQATAGIEPAAAWQALRGELLAQFNITGCCTRCRPSRAGRAIARHARATPVMSCAPWPARGIGSEYRAHVPPIQMLVRTRGTGCASHGVRRAARAVMELAPARPPSAPRGGSRALSTVLPSVAPCSPRQGQALRAREYARP